MEGGESSTGTANQWHQERIQLWLANNVSKRQEEYVRWNDLSVFCGSWNVNNKKPPTAAEMAPWLLPSSPSNNQPDVYVVGLQEVDLTVAGVLTQQTDKALPWLETVEATINSSGTKFLPLSHRQLAGIMVGVWVRESLFPLCSAPHTLDVATGILGMLGNKGGVALSFRIQCSTVCVVCAHLAADIAQVVRRNQDFNDIIKRMRFPVPDQIHSHSGVLSQKSSIDGKFGVYDHDYVFWVGDLNYRLTTTDYQFVHGQIAAAKNAEDPIEGFKELMKHDQLQIQRDNGEVFPHFNECPIAFPPTYKFVPDTQEYVAEAQDKPRIPAWCDRVLYRVKDASAGSVTPHKYSWHPELTISDHKPVSLTLTARTKDIDHSKYQQILREIARDLDRLENEYMPDASISTNALSYGAVAFGDTVRRSFVLTNTGVVPVQYSFKPAPGAASTLPFWITAPAPTGVIMPSSEAVIELNFQTSPRDLEALNAGPEELETVVILHLHQSKDHFLTLSARWRRTVFGVSLTTPTLPKPLWVLADALYQHGAAAAGSLLEGPIPDDLVLIRDSLTELGTVTVGREPGDLDTAYISSVADAFFVYLDCIGPAVVPEELFPAIMAASTESDMRAIPAGLPHAHYLVFIYVMSFVRYMISFEPDDHFVKGAATLLARVICRKPSRASVTQSELRSAAKFVEFFLRS
ncbi:inositol polyphosphate 5-phosphatase ocrl [Carpediemonas membranifera]|uniref:Inositol polyphosphate 5-phosphatase ocrl n=1 Tax=Carpediemonas membranifera TaxID=201153 RepID=A0A8J6BB15_9EUKA|nr:inositol polyphosphate 5-phosphatase ocrl [Carpediemonas membranifera]|eukprot:KAG9396527.1 inositol polyphosphate 5-phosphatase ocrl [Carpediemonas membranifera]